MEFNYKHKYDHSPSGFTEKEDSHPTHLYGLNPLLKTTLHIALIGHLNSVLLLS